MSEAIELYKKDGATAGIYYCSECRAVFKTEPEAKNCHGERLCGCGEPITERYRSKCSACQAKDWREEEVEREDDRFEKAKKIPADQYDGEMVYANDKYYESVDDALDGYLEGQEPEYVWACKNVGVQRADLEDITEHIVENMWEDADSSDLNGLDELQTALDAFNEANRSIRVWGPDYSTAILTHVRSESQP